MNSDLVKCPKCGDEMSSAYSRCVTCGTILIGNDTTENYEKPKLEIDGAKKERVMIPSSIGVLRVFAWLDLLVSIIFSIVIWSDFSTQISRSYITSETVVNPYMIGLGIGVFLQCIFVCALFLVIANIAESLIFIRHNTSKLKN
ncbi:MAG: hypothetical protein K9I71_13240 [Ignavibacteriales bacterium]|nr:hypothetical protein [Ignavibacteriales bacterium]MCF8438674.1 hypothetical protein [Ignavibacteriales bacterium]